MLGDLGEGIADNGAMAKLTIVQYGHHRTLMWNKYYVSVLNVLYSFCNGSMDILTTMQLNAIFLCYSGPTHLKSQIQEVYSTLLGLLMAHK